MVKNGKPKYRRSFLGYVWSILNPLLIMVVMTIVFSTMFSRNIANFPVYLFCGQLLFNFMNSSTHQAIFSITSSSATKLNTQLTMAKQHFSSGKIYLGIYTFFSRGAALMMLPMLVEVD